jgi:hypothetical protein
MKLVILLIVSALGISASALKTESGDNSHTYIDSSGAHIDAITAFKKAMNDEKILDCSPVEAVANARTGKVNLKKKK